MGENSSIIDSGLVLYFIHFNPTPAPANPPTPSAKVSAITIVMYQAIINHGATYDCRPNSF